MPYDDFDFPSSMPNVQAEDLDTYEDPSLLQADRLTSASSMDCHNSDASPVAGGSEEEDSMPDAEMEALTRQLIDEHDGNAEALTKAVEMVSYLNAKDTENVNKQRQKVKPFQRPQPPPSQQQQQVREEREDGQEEIRPKVGKPRSVAEQYATVNARARLSADVLSLLEHIDRFVPTHTELPTQLKPFIPSYEPVISVPELFLFIPPPTAVADRSTDTLFCELNRPGLRSVAEPSILHQSDRTLLVELMAKHKGAGGGDGVEGGSSAVFELQQRPLGSLAQAGVHDPGQRAALQLKLSAFLKKIETIRSEQASLQSSKVVYSRAMPSIDSLMQVWPEQVERESALLDAVCGENNSNGSWGPDLELQVRVVCALLDIPVHPPARDKSSKSEQKSLIEALHVLFTLFTEFRDNAHFS